MASNIFKFSALIIKSVEDDEMLYDGVKAHIESLDCKADIVNLLDNKKPPVADIWFCSNELTLDLAPVYARTVHLPNLQLNDELKVTIANSLIKVKNISDWQEKIISLANKLCLKA